MRLVSTFPRDVRVIENIWIPLADGTRLAARVWLPVDAESRPVPALLEYIPYRKRDRTRERDEPMHYYFAGHGYASVRVDLRGTGDSEGLLDDEYHAQELDDGLEVIAFLSRQTWCMGRVGIMGKSWGGFNGLQLAARRPEALGAILTVCASDDRYTDDAHYMGGCLLNENLIWGSALFTLVGLPPDPEIVGPAWRELWMKRLAHAQPFAPEWLRHPSRDAYWKHGSVRDDYTSIDCPVYAVGGWADAYTNAIPRLLSGLHVPRKGLIGPWAHLYPHNGVPGPAIGFLQEAVRWWDRWLKDVDNGIMDEPMLRVWLSGRWVAESSWPSPNVTTRRLPLELEATASSAGTALGSTDTVGATSGTWCPFGEGDELPSNQQTDDERSLVFDFAPIENGFDILGAPVLRLRLSCNRAQGLLVARLNDVAPDGSSARVSYGLLNLSHRNSHDLPERIVPGQFEDVTLPLNDTAHRFEAGHSLRLALSTSYWPIAWPAPEPFEIRLAPDGGSIELPVRAASALDTDASLASFPPPESGPPAETIDLHEFATRRSRERHPETGESIELVTTDAQPDGNPAMTRIQSTGVEHGHAVRERFRIVDGDPLSATSEVSHDVVFRRAAWKIRVETHHRLSSTESEFRFEAELVAKEDDEEVFRRAWTMAVPRVML